VWKSLLLLERIASVWWTWLKKFFKNNLWILNLDETKPSISTSSSLGWRPLTDLPCFLAAARTDVLPLFLSMLSSVEGLSQFHANCSQILLPVRTKIVLTILCPTTYLQGILNEPSKWVIHKFVLELAKFLLWFHAKSKRGKISQSYTVLNCK
jgi:hypothetical protein